MRVLIFCLILFFPLSARAEAPTNLSADSILYDEKSGNIEASGNVIVVKEYLTLYTDKLIYDASKDSIVMPGKLRLHNSIKKEETYGSYGELSPDLRNGILKSARIIQKQKLQITAGKLKQEKGRYTVLNKAVTSYCKICEENSTPIWEIRSRKVVKDNVKEIIIFEDAMFRVLGVPVLYTPYLHIPHSHVKRASGFLKPSYIYDNKNGLKVFTPYFITLGDHADILLTPWIKSEGVDTVEARFREKLQFGDLNITHASTIDKQSKYRWFLFMTADIQKLPYDFKGVLNLKKTSDATYRSEYGFGSEDRLRNSFSANKTRKNQHIETNLIHYETLRTTENNSTMPNTIVDAEYNKRFTPETIGGFLDIKIDTRGNYRTQSDKNKSDGSSRDVVRLSSLVNWQKDWNVGNGVIAGIGSQIRSNSYKVYQDPSANDIQSFNPSGSVGIKWPIISKKKSNIHFIEPKIQFITSDNGKNAIPNEDSLLPEFDETNLFEFSRFPGVDSYEKGQRVNFGINYTFERLKVFKTIFKIGKILRNKNANQFSNSTGLNGKSSDWLTSSQLNIGPKFTLTNRALLKDDLSILRSELHLDWTLKTLSTTSQYIWLASDIEEGRLVDTSEILLDASYQVANDWNIAASLKYDFIEDKSILSNGLDLVYYTDCTKASFSLNRKEISESEKINELALWLEFGGFGSRANSKLSYSKLCTG